MVSKEYIKEWLEAILQKGYYSKDDLKSAIEEIIRELS